MQWNHWRFFFWPIIEVYYLVKKILLPKFWYYSKGSTVNMRNCPWKFVILLPFLELYISQKLKGLSKSPSQNQQPTVHNQLLETSLSAWCQRKKLFNSFFFFLNTQKRILKKYLPEFLKKIQFIFPTIKNLLQRLACRNHILITK